MSDSLRDYTASCEELLIFFSHYSDSLLTLFCHCAYEFAVQYSITAQVIN